MAKPGLTVVQDNIPNMLRGVALMTSTRVMVGVPATQALRKPEPGETRSPPNNALLAYVHENGDAAGRIPPRPFMKPAIDENRAETEERLKNVAFAALAGRDGAVTQGLHALGLRAQGWMRRKITAGPFLPLAPVTIAKRRARGRMGTKPLIDTGQLRNALNYVLRAVGRSDILRKPPAKAA